MNLWKEVSLAMLRVRFPALAEWLSDAPDDVVREFTELIKTVREGSKNG